MRHTRSLVDGTKLAVAGGKADGKPDSAFDQAELALGQKTELEHTSDKAMAKDIAKDHLVEFPKYYSKVLLPAERKAEKQESFKPAVMRLARSA
jgi:hypothetical protein